MSECHATPLLVRSADKLEQVGLQDPTVGMTHRTKPFSQDHYAAHCGLHSHCPHQHATSSAMTLVRERNVPEGFYQDSSDALRQCARYPFLFTCVLLCSSTFCVKHSEENLWLIVLDLSSPPAILPIASHTYLTSQ